MNVRAGVIAVVIAAMCGVATAETTLRTEVGWASRMRVGRWTPITVTLTDPKPRAAYLELSVPQGGTSVMRIRQDVTIGPAPTTFQLFAPLSAADELALTVHDAVTDKTLARYPREKEDAYAYSGVFMGTPTPLFGASGSGNSLGLMQTELSAIRAQVAYIDLSLLPSAAVGYDMLDVLVLNRPNLFQVAAQQQKAILEWVRAGGSLILWASDDPVPSGGPFVDALPCRIGAIADYPLTAEDHHVAGLMARFGVLRVRALTPTEGAEPIPLFPSATHEPSPSLTAYRRNLGFGTILVSPVSLAELQFNDTAAALKFWQPILQGTGALEQQSSEQTPGAAGTLFQRQATAVATLQDYLGDVPGAGQFGFSYVAYVLIGMMVVVGPVDWFVLKKLGRQPWTWVTTSGWIGFVTLGAVYIGHVFKSGDLHYRTIRVIDQMGDRTAGEASLAMIYSPRTTDYHLDAPAAAGASAKGINAAGIAPDSPPGWWSPAIGEVRYASRSALHHDVPFGQSDQGNAPEGMLIDVWNMRFLSSREPGGGAAIVEANLKWSDAQGTPRILGSIKNLSDRPLTNLRVRVFDGFAAADGAAPLAALINRLEPGAASAVDAPVAAKVAINTDVKSNRYGGYRYDDSEPPEASALWKTAGDLATVRSQRIEHLLKTGRYVVIYAEMVDPPPPAALREPEAKQVHYQLIRAVAPLRGAPSATSTPAVPFRQQAPDDPTTLPAD